MLSIEQIRPELTWRLRREVLYPESQLSEMELEEDKYGYHFGAFGERELLGVVSLFQDGTDFQFRKFAVVAHAQGMGVGTALLARITEFAVNDGAQRFWCNARTSAIGFYLQFGFEQTGKLFSKNGFDYEIMEKIIRI